jgi:hypothetical protein
MKRPRIDQVVVAVAILAGCSSSPLEVTTIHSADGFTVYEGLPHQLYEAAALQKEKDSKPTVEFDGFPFYRDPLAVTARDRNQLENLLGAAGTYRPFAGEKKCGGFHPDYAVEWTSRGSVHRVLICFGCGEVKISSPTAAERYDIAQNAQDRLRAVLKPYRKNRPDTGNAGP